MRRKQNNSNYNFDRLLRNFRNKVKRSGLMDDLRKKEYYEKPAQRKQRLKNAAKRREAKRNKETQLQPLRLKDRLPFKKR
jgi:small subunit ribosomal protein S21